MLVVAREMKRRARGRAVKAGTDNLLQETAPIVDHLSRLVSAGENGAPISCVDNVAFPNVRDDRPAPAPVRDSEGYVQLLLKLRTHSTELYDITAVDACRSANAFAVDECAIRAIEVGDQPALG